MSASKRQKPLTDLQKQALDLLMQDLPLTRAAVARQLGIPVSTVKVWATAAGIAPGKRGRPLKYEAGYAASYGFRLPPSLHSQAMAVLDQVGVENVAELLEGLANGILEIQIAER